MAKLLMAVNEDRFFLSHRAPVALRAKARGFDTTIVAKDTGRSGEIADMGLGFTDLPVNPTGMDPRQELKTLRFLYRLYGREKPSIVHHVGMKNILWGGLAARLRGVPGVVNAVSGLGGLFNDGKVTLTSSIILSLIRFSARRKGVRFIFQNNDDLSIFLSHNVINPDQVEFTKGSGIDLTDYAYVPEPQDGGPITVIFTARMVREKGVCDLIEAAGMLRPEFEGRARFILCGRLTPNKSSITPEYMEAHCDGSYICWLGERSDIKQLLAESHIMAFPSYYREGLPKSLIEACATGRPIVTCDSTGCRDAVTDGENGFLVAPRSPRALADRLRTLITDPELRRRMGEASRRRAERDFDINSVVDTHMRIYDSLSDTTALQA